MGRVGENNGWARKRLGVKKAYKSALVKAQNRNFFQQKFLKTILASSAKNVKTEPTKRAVALKAA